MNGIRPAVYTEEDRARERCEEWLSAISIGPTKRYAVVLEDDGNCFYLQVRSWVFNTASKGPEMLTGRKWRISYHCCKSEFVRTVYKAVEAFVLHELQEDFKYKGVAIYNPHIDPDALLEAAQVIDTRAPR